MIGLKTETKNKIAEEKNGNIYDLNLPTEETITNTLTREDEFAIEPEKTKKKTDKSNSSKKLELSTISR